MYDTDKNWWLEIGGCKTQYLKYVKYMAKKKKKRYNELLTYNTQG